MVSRERERKNERQQKIFAEAGECDGIIFTTPGGNDLANFLTLGN